MNKKLFSMMLLVFLICLMFTSVQAYEAFRGPTELIYWDKEKAFNGYTLFATRGTGTPTYLIDMGGNVVHSWAMPADYDIEKTARLLPNGNLIREMRSAGQRGGTGQKGAVFQELNWKGEVVWEFKDSRPGYVAHHNFKRIFNKKMNAYTTIIISTKAITQEQAVAAGCDPSKEYKGARPDAITEVDMEGNIVWEWWSFDHIIQEKNSTWPNYGVVKDNPGKMDLHSGRGVRGDWVHFNSLDYNEELDQIVGNASSFSEFWIIDHGATFVPGDLEASMKLAAGPKGDIMYRWGNPNAYDEGKQQVHFTHDIQWIKSGLPGAGNLLLFDNGSRGPSRDRSIIVEVNPYKGPMKDGIYVDERKAGYNKQGISNQIVWAFRSVEPNSFFSSNISGCQRLPNGNTLVTSGRHGHIFEVTKSGEVVWEYINPVTREAKSRTVKIMTDDVSNALFTSHRYGPDYPGLKGRDLTPMGQITNPKPKTTGVLIKGGGKKGGKGGKNKFN